MADKQISELQKATSLTGNELLVISQDGKAKNVTVDELGQMMPDGGSPDAVLYTPQTLTDAQKAQARENIGADKALDYTAYGLPVLELTGDVSAMTKDNAVNLAYKYGDRSGTASVKWQGSSSLAYPKKNYTIKFDNAFEAVEGWGEQKKYCLKANFIDHSHARNLVNAKLWGQLVKSRKSTGGITGAINSGGEMDVSDRVIVSDGIVTVRTTVAYVGEVLFEGPTFSAGQHTVSFEVFNPYSAEDNGSFAVLTFGTVGNNSSVNVNTVEAYNTWLNRSFTVEFPVDNSMIGFVIYNFNGKLEANNDVKIGYSFRNIKVDGVPYQLTPDMTELNALPNGGAVDGFPCIISLNGEFHGLYTFNIPKDGWMFGMNDTTIPQAILCANDQSNACGFKALATLNGDFDLEYVSDESNSDWVLTSLNTLISAVMNSDGTDLDTTVAKYLDWNSAIDYLIFTSLVGGTDMYRKNYLLATYDGVKWFFSAYDMDSTHGLWWQGKDFFKPSQYPHINDYNHRVMELIMTYKTDELKARYEELRASAMSEENLYLEFTNWAAKLPTPILMEDVKRWPTVPSSAASNTAQILNWYRMRVGVEDERMQKMVSVDNLVPTSFDKATGEVYNGTGYSDTAFPGYVQTGYIKFSAHAITQAGVEDYVSPVMYVKGDVSFDSSANSCLNTLTADKTTEAHHSTAANGGLTNYYNITELGTGYYKIEYLGDGKQNKIGSWTTRTPEYIALSMKGTGAGLVVTVGKPIE